MAYCPDCDKYMHINEYHDHLPCKGRKRKQQTPNNRASELLAESTEAMKDMPWKE